MREREFAVSADSVLGEWLKGSEFRIKGNSNPEIPIPLKDYQVRIIMKANAW